MKAPLALIVLSPLLIAATPLERQIFSAPMPHAALGGNGMQKAHYVRTELRRTAEETAGYLKLWRMQADTCSALNARLGKPVRPPREYPDFTRIAIIDTYWAPNRAVEYRRGYVAGIDGKDCSLLEIEKHEAKLHSAHGTCKVDLIRRSAKGECDAAAHQQAPVITMPPGSREGIPNGQRRTLAGVECIEGSGQMGSGCFAKGGSFPAPWLLGARQDVGIPVAANAGAFGEAVPIQVRFDAQVSPAVFTPQLGASLRAR